MDDPSAAISIPNQENVTPLEQDAFMVAGQRDGSIVGLNFVHGEVRGHDGEGSRNQRLHLSSIYRQVVIGGTSMARHPLTDDIYLAGRGDRTIRAWQWLRDPTGYPDVYVRQGIAGDPPTTASV